MRTRWNRLFQWMMVGVGIAMAAACSHGGAPGEGDEEGIELTVFAAASLKDVLTEIQEVYEKEYPKVRLTFHFASSGKLQRQIEQGASADLFLSAGKKEMNALLQKGRIDPDHHVDLLKNQLVFIVPEHDKDSWAGMEDLTQAERISIGQPDTVPAGDYAKQVLEQMGLWEELQPRIVFSADVRQVLTYVVTGNVDAGFVYQTDAKHADSISVVETIDSESHEPIQYPVGIVKATAHPEEARKLYEWLQGDQARSIFVTYGFDVQ